MMTAGSCSTVGMLFGVAAMVTPLIVIAAIIYLVAVTLRRTNLREAG